MKYLIVGLGNIGPEYADTRHNIGFKVADALVKQSGATFSKMNLVYFSEINYRGRTLCVIKPTTYMNLSGKAVNYWMKLLKIPLDHVLIIVDELALPFGKLRLKPKGSSAGHNGLKSIEQLLGTSDYARLRFGIGDMFPRGRQVDYVLSGFDTDELPELPALIDRSVEIVNAFVTIGPELTMTKFNQ